MNGVLGSVELLLADSPSLTVDQKELVDTIKTSSRTLLSLINDILDFGKLNTGM